MLAEFEEKNKVDGQILFFAVDSSMKRKGIGSLLLKELSKRETGKRIYLFTDSFCTYQFYDNNSFKKEDEKDIYMTIHNKKIKFTCYLYSKNL